MSTPAPTSWWSRRGSKQSSASRKSLSSAKHALDDADDRFDTVRPEKSGARAHTHTHDSSRHAAEHNNGSRLGALATAFGWRAKRTLDTRYQFPPQIDTTIARLTTPTSTSSASSYSNPRTPELDPEPPSKLSMQHSVFAASDDPFASSTPFKPDPPSVLAHARRHSTSARSSFESTPSQKSAMSSHFFCHPAVSSAKDKFACNDLSTLDIHETHFVAPESTYDRNRLARAKSARRSSELIPPSQAKLLQSAGMVPSLLSDSAYDSVSTERKHGRKRSIKVSLTGKGKHQVLELKDSLVPASSTPTSTSASYATYAQSQAKPPRSRAKSPVSYPHGPDTLPYPQSGTRKPPDHSSPAPLHSVSGIPPPRTRLKSSMSSKASSSTPSSPIGTSSAPKVASILSSLAPQPHRRSAPSKKYSKGSTSSTGVGSGMSHSSISFSSLASVPAPSGSGNVPRPLLPRDHSSNSNSGSSVSGRSGGSPLRLSRSSSRARKGSDAASDANTHYSTSTSAGSKILFSSGKSSLKQRERVDSVTSSISLSSVRSGVSTGHNHNNHNGHLVASPVSVASMESHILRKQRSLASLPAPPVPPLRHYSSFTPPLPVPLQPAGSSASGSSPSSHSNSNANSHSHSNPNSYSHSNSHSHSSPGPGFGFGGGDDPRRPSVSSQSPSIGSISLTRKASSGQKQRQASTSSHRPSSGNRPSSSGNGNGNGSGNNSSRPGSASKDGAVTRIPLAPLPFPLPPSHSSHSSHVHSPLTPSSSSAASGSGMGGGGSSQPSPSPRPAANSKLRIFRPRAATVNDDSDARSMKSGYSHSAADRDGGETSLPLSSLSSLAGFPFSLSLPGSNGLSFWDESMTTIGMMAKVNGNSGGGGGGGMEGGMGSPSRTEFIQHIVPPAELMKMDMDEPMGVGDDVNGLWGVGQPVSSSSMVEHAHAHSHGHGHGQQQGYSGYKPSLSGLTTPTRRKAIPSSGINPSATSGSNSVDPHVIPSPASSTSSQLFPTGSSPLVSSRSAGGGGGSTTAGMGSNSSASMGMGMSGNQLSIISAMPTSSPPPSPLTSLPPPPRSRLPRLRSASGLSLPPSRSTTTTSASASPSVPSSLPMPKSFGTYSGGTFSKSDLAGVSGALTPKGLSPATSRSRLPSLASRPPQPPPPTNPAPPSPPSPSSPPSPLSPPSPRSQHSHLSHVSGSPTHVLRRTAPPPTAPPSDLDTDSGRTIRGKPLVVAPRRRPSFLDIDDDADVECESDLGRSFLDFGSRRSNSIDTLGGSEGGEW
ncbi:hypothetical protein BOTBODRAFT_172183 [Botryobasidium botryosum FD-172 SS1]|uniref:Uncharacterized protein n=1 Tax=Botryobasidium botryosum (strain FD-172 SS1) TaxID=930990 RepID=A0A067N1V5_BOTB1|nr:hypothetical protein BOTBODRAFT_172183 [Botryobasidium botryosum FD-172 SS1]